MMMMLMMMTFLLCVLKIESNARTASGSCETRLESLAQPFLTVRDERCKHSAIKTSTVV